VEALKFILPIYAVLFLFWGAKNFKYFLLFTGIMTMPFRTTYTVIDVGPYIGWTNGVNIALSDVSFIVLFLYLLVTRKRFARPVHTIAQPVLIFVGACLLSLFNSSWIRISLYEVLLVVQSAFLYYFVLVYAIENEKDLRAVVLFLVLSLLFQSGFAITQYASGLDFDVFATGSVEVAEGGEEFVARAVGTLGRPNGLAVYIVPLLFLTLAIRFLSGYYKRLSVIAIASGSIALLLTGSRGGWVAFLVSFVIFAFMLLRRGRIGLRALSVLLLCGAFLVFVFFPYLQERVAGEASTNAALSRIPLLKVAWHMIIDHPILGVGANTFMTAIYSYTKPAEFQGIWLGLVHNHYLLVLAETGLVGLAAFLWLFYSFLRESAVCGRIGNPLAQILGLSTGVAFTSMAIHMMFDIYSSGLALGMMFVLTGLCSAARSVFLVEEDGRSPLPAGTRAYQPRIERRPSARRIVSHQGIGIQ
jgi:O-antigen ligase